MTDLVHLELGRTTILRLNNPPLNLVTQELTARLDAVLAQLETTPGIRAVVVAGNDRAFCAGSDINEFDALPGRVGEGKLLREGAVYRRLARLPYPTIAAIEGAALGGGLELALCCDLRVAANSARLGLPEVGLGVIPGSGGTQRLTRLVGPGRAKELILLGEPIDAAEAHRIGLVERIAEPGQAEAEARRIGEVVGRRAPLAVRAAKRLIDTAPDVDLDAGLRLELDASEEVFASDDMQEGTAAFREKRPPDFSGS